MSQEIRSDVGTFETEIAKKNKISDLKYPRKTGPAHLS